MSLRVRDIERFCTVCFTLERGKGLFGSTKVPPFYEGVKLNFLVVEGGQRDKKISTKVEGGQRDKKI